MMKSCDFCWKVLKAPLTVRWNISTGSSRAAGWSSIRWSVCSGTSWRSRPSWHSCFIGWSGHFKGNLQTLCYSDLRELNKELLLQAESLGLARFFYIYICKNVFEIHFYNKYCAILLRLKYLFSIWIYLKIISVIKADKHHYSSLQCHMILQKS